MLKALKEPYVVGVAARGLGQLIAFLSVVVASRYLDLAVFGTFALAWAGATIGTSFVFTGLYQALLRSRDLARDGDAPFWLNLGVGLAFTTLLALAGLLSGGLATAQGAALLAVAPIPALVVPQAWWEARLIRERRVRAASLYPVLAELGGLLLMLWLLLAGWQIGALIAARYVSAGLALGLAGALAGGLPRPRLRRDSTRAAQGTALPLWATSSVGLFNNYGADILLGAFAPAATVGAYRGGARIAVTVSSLVVQPLTTLSWSRFTRIEKAGGGAEALRRAWVENTALGAAIIWPMNTTLALLAPALVVTLLDPGWLAAAGVVSILAVSRAISFLSALLEPAMLTAGHPRAPFRIRLAGAVSLLVLLVIVARHGAEAAALAHAASALLVAGLSLVAFRHALALSARHLAAVVLPGIGLSALVAVLILGAGALAPGTGAASGLLLQLGLVAAGWGAAMALLLRRGVIILPAP